MTSTNTQSIKNAVERGLASGYITKPPLGTVVDPEDYEFIRELRGKGDTYYKIANILHVTEEAVKAVLKDL